jgi:hypothetical protein
VREEMSSMTHPSKRKGNHYERELVSDAVALGIEAERAYASNGRALGHAEDVDCVIGGQRVQAKRRKALASFLRPSASVDAVAFREDRGETFVLLRWSDWLKLLRK